MKLLKRNTAPVQSDRDQRLAWRIAALLLDYPKPETLDLLPDLRVAAEGMVEMLGKPLIEFIDYAVTKDQISLGREYVETFDLKRRSSLHLTYYAHGDTRGRGMALLRFKHAYKSAGAPLSDESGELPDHISVVLEFAATVDPIGGARLLGEHLPVLELLRLSLEDQGSTYRHVVGAVAATLPPITTADRRRIEQLAAAGPPQEEVGLEHPMQSVSATDPYALDDTYNTPDGGRR